MNADSGLLKESHFNLKGFEIVRFDRDFNKAGGLAICIKNGIIFQKVDLGFKSDSLEIGAAKIDSNLGEILITIAYRSPIPNNNISKSDWCKFIDVVSNYGSKHFIVAGDFNAHHPFWGSAKQCCNGNVILDNLNYENFILLNNNSPTHVKISNLGCSFSNIDLTFVSPGLALISEWQVQDDRWGSNHFPIFLEINAEPIYNKK